MKHRQDDDEDEEFEASFELRIFDGGAKQPKQVAKGSSCEYEKTSKNLCFVLDDDDLEVSVASVVRVAADAKNCTLEFETKTHEIYKLAFDSAGFLDFFKAHLPNHF